MNTLSIIALVVIGLCVGYIGYCIYGAWRISRRNCVSPPQECPHDASPADKEPSSETNNNQ